MHKLYCSQHAMFTMCILFSTLTTKAKGVCEGASKQSQGLKQLYCTGTAPPWFLNSWIRHWFGIRNQVFKGMRSIHRNSAEEHSGDL